MKLLTAFALFAVAFAAEQVQVVDLPRARAPALENVDFRPLMIPQSVIDALKAAYASKHAGVDEALRVKVVDTPLKENVEAVVPEQIEIAEPSAEETDAVVADESLKVKFVDAPLEDVQAETNVPEPNVEQDESLKVRIVDDPSIFNQDETLKVRIVDSPAEAEETVLMVKPVVLGRIPTPEYEVLFVDAPLEDVQAETNVPEPNVEQDESLKVRIVEGPSIVNQDETLKVRIVDAPAQVEEAVLRAKPIVLRRIPVPEYEVPSFVASRYPAKVYPDPRLRHRVQSFDVPTFPAKVYSDPRLR